MTADRNRITLWKILLSTFFPYLEDSYKIFHDIFNERSLFAELKGNHARDLSWERILTAINFGARIPDDYVNKIRDQILALSSALSVGSEDEKLEILKEHFLREMVAFWGSILIAREAKDQRFISRLATFESKRFNSIMTLIIKDRDIFSAIAELEPGKGLSVLTLLTYIAKQLGLRVREFSYGNIQTRRAFGVHFLDYIECAPTRSGSWKLINRIIKEGYVLFSVPIASGIIDRENKDVIRLLESAVSITIKKKVEELISYENLDIPEWVTEMAIKALRYYESLIPKEALVDEGEKYWPPCMRAIIGEIRAGKSLPHQARFAITTFLHAIGWSEEEMLDLYRNFPDFDEEKARYQIRHITGQVSGKIYSVPSCETMLSYGYCFRGSDELNLCSSVKHPMQYYLMAIRILNKEINKRKKEQRPSKDHN